MSTELTLISGNAGKVAEISAAIGRPLQAQTLRLQEIQSMDTAAVAAEKARSAFEALGRPVLVDDTGLSIDALGGLPGPLVAWFLQALGPGGLAAALPEGAARTATAETVLGYADAAGVRCFTGRVAGRIADQPRGSGGFGFDAIFMPEGSTLTFAEMSVEAKAALSPRTRAVDALRAFLDANPEPRT
jgi:XTP/dITP diphosphohydrolase